MAKYLRFSPGLDYIFCHLIGETGVYSVGFFKGDNYQVGCIGISDMSHIFWPILFNICDGERTEHVVKMYQHMLSLIAAIVKGITEMFFLKDGGTAIDSATSILIQNYVQSHVILSYTMSNTSFPWWFH